MHVYCSYIGGVPRASSSSYPCLDEAPPSRLRGSGQEKEVKLRGGASGLGGERRKERQCGSTRRASKCGAIGSRRN